MVDFAGWHMPLSYSGVTEEHNQVRTSGGLFDVSHMGRVKVKGRHARKLLDKLCSRKIASMQPGQCRYSLVCNEQGGIKDDVIVMRLDDDDFIVVVNASNREKLLEHFNQVKEANSYTVTIDDQTAKTAMVALQGPKVMDLISKISTEIPSLKRYRFAVKNLVFMKLYVSRTGYTGEDGVEVILPASAVGMALRLLLKDAKVNEADAIIKPAGLAARDTLRLEAGMPLYGHELGEDTNALSTGLDFAIALDKGEDNPEEKFIGQDALLATRDAGGPPVKLVGLALEGKRSPRQGMGVLHDGTNVGTVTSGCPSPTLGHPIAMAYVNKELAEPGTTLQIDAGRAALDATVVAMPFYKAPK